MKMLRHRRNLLKNIIRLIRHGESAMVKTISAIWTKGLTPPTNDPMEASAATRSF